jgi:hypothetical protein
LLQAALGDLGPEHTVQEDFNWVRGLVTLHPQDIGGQSPSDENQANLAQLPALIKPVRKPNNIFGTLSKKSLKSTLKPNSIFGSYGKRLFYPNNLRVENFKKLHSNPRTLLSLASALVREDPAQFQNLARIAPPRITPAMIAPAMIAPARIAPDKREALFYAARGRRAGWAAQVRIS